MAMNTFFSFDQQSMNRQPMEFVERKGIGHPDTLADGVAEALSIDYSEYCLKHFGVVLHQMLDKVMFLGGLGKVDFGRGEMVAPWRLIINGRLSRRFNTKYINYEKILEKAAKNYLNRVVPKLDTEKWLKIHHFTTNYGRVDHWFNPKSIEDLPDAKNPYANDTSVAFGYWPLSMTEKLTLLMEAYFYMDSGRPRFEYIGQDIKVLCIRKLKHIDITICVPMFGTNTPNRRVYEARLSKIHSELVKIAKNFVGDKYTIKLFMNTQDQKKEKKSVGQYLVVSGSALDYGEEGVVGRGNRSRGIISTMRPYSMEGINGKNPVYYVGKVYNYIADKLSKRIAEEFECECYVFISSRNSDPLSKPHRIFVQLNEKRDIRKINKIIKEELGSGGWANEIIENKPFLPFPGGGNGYRSRPAHILENAKE